MPSPELGEHMQRREFITLLGGTAAVWPLAARAQQPERMRRIGVLMGYPEDDLEGPAFFAAFREGLEKLGWVENRNIRFETRWAAPEDAEARQRFAKELVALQPDLILSAVTPTTAALLEQTRTIPIVFALVADPVGSGFVASLARPGGNTTGFWQVVGATQGDCAARRPRRLPVQPDDGEICRILPEPLQSGRCVHQSRGDLSPGSRQLGARIRHSRTGSGAE
jgi:ABC transporter substrate binding protein